MSITINEPKKPTKHITFSLALKYLKEGKLVTRKGWNQPESFLYLVQGSTFTVNRAPLLGIFPEGTEINYHAHIDIRTANGQCMPWHPSQMDILATDWFVVEQPIC